MSRTAAILMLLLLLANASMASGDGRAGAACSVAEGSASSRAATLICTVSDLQNICNDPNGSYELANDIDASATTTWNFGAGFKPVGTKGNSFKGILDGKNHTVKGLFIDRSTADHVGLFGYIGNGGLVMNIGLVDINVIGHEYTGGLVGSNDHGTVANSYATGNVTGKKDVGGLIARNYRGKVSDSHATGNVYGTNNVGGLIGSNEGSVNNSYATGNVNGRYEVGGLVGWHSENSVNNSFATGNVNGIGYVGGLVGGLWGSGTVDNSHYNIDKVSINGGHHVTTCGLFDAQYQDWFSSGLSLNISDYRTSLTPSGGYFDIRGAQGLRDLLGFAGSYGYRFRLMADIVLPDDSGLFIPYLVADFDGNNHTISNLNVTLPFVCVLGMFGYNAGGTIQNIGIVDNDVNGGDYVGGLVGCNFHGSVNNSYVTGNVTGTGPCVGGLVGLNLGTVDSSFATGDVTGNDAVGGLVGENVGWVKESYATGNVTGTGDVVGGLVGYEDGAVDNSYATGNVAGNNSIGGLLGLCNRDMVNDSYSTGRVHGNSDIGGLVGCNQDGTVSNCFWDTETSGLSSSSGGTGKTTAQMKTRSTFTDAGWDFEHVWSMIENVTYPLLGLTGIEPRADAGADITVDEGALVTFDGSGSFDAYGIVNCIWTLKDVVPVTLYGVHPIFRFGNPGRFVVTLNVTNVFGHWSTDTMTVTVIDITAPVADAGPDQIIDERTLVQFNGNGSSDDVGIVNYSWTFRDGVPVTLYGLRPTYRFDNPGILVVTLEVADAAGLQDNDTLSVTVRDITAPVVEAGPDQTIDEGTTVTFDGSGSRDNAIIVNYAWTFTDGELVTLCGVQPTYKFDNPGFFVVMLNVTDDAGNWNTDNMIVAVKDITAPCADAGPNRTVDERTRVTFDGGGSSDNVGIVNYTWTFDYSAARIILCGVSPSFAFGIPGIYSVKLNVSDAAGFWDEDTMTLAVRDITPPVADAGKDQRVPAGSTLVLDGSLSWDNCVIATRYWNFTYHAKMESLQGENVSFRFDEGGVYEIVLTVIDGSGNRAEDKVVITVVDTGIITGTVLDRNGKPVEAATIKILSSDSRESSIQTAANGSFIVEIHHGNFTWNVAKEGYQPISGRSSVKAMDGVTLEIIVNNALPHMIPPKQYPFTMEQFPWLLLLVVLAATGVMAALRIRGRRVKKR